MCYITFDFTHLLCTMYTSCCIFYFRLSRLLITLTFINSDFSWINQEFIIISIIAGVIGFGLNVASFRCIQQTSAVTYAVVGAMNKIPLMLLGKSCYWHGHYHIFHQGSHYLLNCWQTFDRKHGIWVRHNSKEHTVYFRHIAWWLYIFIWSFQ